MARQCGRAAPIRRVVRSQDSRHPASSGRSATAAPVMIATGGGGVVGVGLTPSATGAAPRPLPARPGSPCRARTRWRGRAASIRRSAGRRRRRPGCRLPSPRPGRRPATGSAPCRAGPSPSRAGSAAPSSAMLATQPSSGAADHQRRALAGRCHEHDRQRRRFDREQDRGEAPTRARPAASPGRPSRDSAASAGTASSSGKASFIQNMGCTDRVAEVGARAERTSIAAVATAAPAAITASRRRARGAASATTGPRAQRLDQRLRSSRAAPCLQGKAFQAAMDADLHRGFRQAGARRRLGHAQALELTWMIGEAKSAPAGSRAGRAGRGAPRPPPAPRRRARRRPRRRAASPSARVPSARAGCRSACSGRSRAATP